GPGRLPYAVAAFFENGGRRAYVTRIVHDYGDGHAANDEATAVGRLLGLSPRGGGECLLLARDEGSWGNRLKATVSFRSRPLAFRAATVSRLVLALDAPVAIGTLLRCWLPGGIPELL